MKKIFLIILCSIFIGNIQAQQIAFNKAINLIEIIDHIKMKNPAEDIYDEVWNNKTVTYDKDFEIVDKYLIDLTDFNMPLKKEKIVVTSNYGYRKQFKRHHKGIDLDVNKGDTIYATFSGKIRISNYKPNGYGHYVVIRHYNGLETIYGHMSKRLVNNDEYVKVGQPIGIGGNTGRSTGAHLHFETRFCGVPIDPIKIFDFNYQDIVSDSYQFSYKKK